MSSSYLTDSLVMQGKIALLASVMAVLVKCTANSCMQPS